MEIFKLFGSIFVDDKDANNSIAKVEKNAQGLGDRLGNGIKTAAKWGAAIAAGATVAAGAVAGMAAPLVKAAAGTQAMNAQFEQVFGNIGSEAQKTIDGLGKDFGMVPNRIKPALTQMTSMFKGLGMETGEAMGTAKDAVTLVADAAAFYDKSFEDANSALNSFIKGNYEGGESIGLFANETQLAAYASKELGLDWKKLDEAGKQVARLEYAKAMQESAGATGQAARESNSLENQLGNLKQAWEDIKARFGAPILEPAVNGLKNLAEWLQNVDTEPIVNGFEFVARKVGDFATLVKENVIPTLVGLWEWFKPHLPMIQNLFQLSFGIMKDILSGVIGAIKETTQWMKEHWNIVGPILAGIAGGIVTFQLITGAIAAYGAITKAITAVQIAFNTALSLNPIGIVVLAIGALIAAGVLLWKNWDTVKEKLNIFWAAIKVVFGNIRDFVSGVWDGMVSGIKGAVNKIIGAMNGMIRGLNKVKFEVPDWVPLIGGKGWGFNLGTIPMLAEGGEIKKAGRVLVGEAGPEVLDLPEGAKVTPLDHPSLEDPNKEKEIVQNTPIIRIEPAPIYLDKHEIAQIIYKEVDDLISFDNGRVQLFEGRP
ncbi:hypothetical protein [Fredinandcohnia sp. 179-A 10B2 NHS]|uniref:hypothetical protein n=1 Tax=Fredinandcohnia sp. 179-A 10B2 NHS TaxID=3235176 RepID=UPI00399F31CA